MENHKVQNKYHSPLPYEYLREEDLPDNFSWGNVNGTSFLTHSLNQVRTKRFALFGGASVELAAAQGKFSKVLIQQQLIYSFLNTTPAHSPILWQLLGSWSIVGVIGSPADCGIHRRYVRERPLASRWEATQQHILFSQFRPFAQKFQGNRFAPRSTCRFNIF